MPKSEEIKDKFFCDYDDEILKVFRSIKEKDLLKIEDSGNQMVDFAEFILYNIDVNKYYKKNSGKKISK